MPFIICRAGAILPMIIIMVMATFACLASASEVVVSGCSAGGLAVYLHVDK